MIVTLAPEQVSPEQIERLARSGVHVCAGHTDASYQQVRDASGRGLQGITHLFNAMSPLTAREPGVVGAALDDDRLWAGIIADGHHVHPASIRLAHAAKPAGKLVLVTDAMAPVGGQQSSFRTLWREHPRTQWLSGQCRWRPGRQRDRYDRRGALRHLEVGIPLAECLRMASLYPAAILNLDDSAGANRQWLPG